MINIVEVISTAFDSAQKRLVKFYRMGRQDVQDCVQSTPAGIDSSPIKGMRAIYAQTPERGKNYVVGYLSENQLAEPGETRVFSVDSSGELKAWMWFKGDGTIEILGSDDNLMKYAQAAATIEEIQQDIAALKQAFTTWVPVPSDGGAALKAAAASWFAQPLVEQIAGAKFDEVKTK
jgi:hypothetical protein